MLTKGFLNFRGLFLGLMAGAAAVAAGQSVFDMPRLFPQHKRYLQQFLVSTQRNDLLGAETAARAGAKLFPNDANWHYNVACICSRDGRPDEALEWLEKAIDRGFTHLKQLSEDPDLNTLRFSPKAAPVFAQLVEKARNLALNPPANATLSRAIATPVLTGSEVTVSAENTQWNWDPVSGGIMETLLRLQPAPSLPPYTGPYADLVNELTGGTASCAGLLYVNRDEDLSVIDYAAFPGLTPVLYSEEAQAAGAHRGTANGTFSSGLAMIPAIGHSTLAVGNSMLWRSIPRAIATDPAGMRTAFNFAAANQLYLYDASPDLSKDFKGDLLFAQNPAMILSVTPGAPEEAKAAQRELTELLVAAVAVMQPDTRRAVFFSGSLVPTLQCLLRSHLKGAPDYLSAAAHPTAFHAGLVDAEAFLRAANALTPEQLPPALQIRVRQETMPRAGIDYFDAVGSEAIADTPTCVTRIIRGSGLTRKLTLEALSPEPGLTYEWFALNGDPAKVSIRKLTSSGSLTTLSADWHAPYEKDGLLMRRVDFACVAKRKDGTCSAPAFVSFRYLANERRTYSDAGKILSIDYTLPAGADGYEDPALSAFKNWRDDYHYNAQGRLTGWTRTAGDGTVSHYDSRGRRIVETDADGSPKRVVTVSYMPRIIRSGDGVTTPAIELLPSDSGSPFTVKP